MADTKIVGGKGLVREEHEHKRDCDCKVIGFVHDWAAAVEFCG